MNALQKQIVEYADACGFKQDEESDTWRKASEDGRFTAEVRLITANFTEVALLTHNYREWELEFQNTTPGTIWKEIIKGAARYEK